LQLAGGHSQAPSSVLGVIDAEQFAALVDAVEDWRPALDADGLSVEDEPRESGRSCGKALRQNQV